VSPDDEKPPPTPFLSLGTFTLVISEDPFVYSFVTRLQPFDRGLAPSRLPTKEVRYNCNCHGRDLFWLLLSTFPCKYSMLHFPRQEILFLSFVLFVTLFFSSYSPRPSIVLPWGTTRLRIDRVASPLPTSSWIQCYAFLPCPLHSIRRAVPPMPGQYGGSLLLDWPNQPPRFPNLAGTLGQLSHPLGSTVRYDNLESRLPIKWSYLADIFPTEGLEFLCLNFGFIFSSTRFQHLREAGK